MADVVVGSELALARVRVEQGVGRIAGKHHAQFPREVLGILQAAVGAARTERRHPVRCIADEEHAAVAEAVHAFA